MHESQVQIGTVDFHGNELITVLYRNIEYVAMKPVVEGMGLSWQGQQTKIRTSLTYQAVLIPLRTGGGTQEMLCIPLARLNGWLFSITPGKVRQEIRPTVELYQEECFVVLYNYWHGGAAVNPRAQDGCQQITVARIVSEAEAAVELCRLLRREDEQTRLFIIGIIRAVYDIDCLVLTTGVADASYPGYGKKTPPVCEKEDIWLTPTQLGRRLGLSPHKTNQLLKKHGLVESYRNRQNHLRWRPTAKGRPYVMPEHVKKKPNGSRRQCLMFSESVIEIIGQKKTDTQ